MMASGNVIVPVVHAVDLWNEAIQLLSSEEKTTILNHSSTTPATLNTDVDTLLKAAQEKREICEKKRWTLKFRGKEVMMRDVVDRICTWLDNFKQIGDIIVNVDPIHGGLPWAGIRLLLQAVLSEKQQMADLLTGLDRILYLLNRCKVYEALYIQSVQPTAAKLAVENLRRGLVQLYLAIQRFIARALVLLKQSTLSRGSQAFIRPGDVSELEKRFQEWEKQVEVEAENCERFQNSTSRADVVQSVEQLKSLLTQMNSQNQLLITMDIKLTAIWNSIAEDEYLRILTWVSNIPYQDNHYFARKGRTPGTGDWLLNHPKYQQWISSDKSLILWLYGIPGAGKTKLVSNIVNSLYYHSPDEALAYFYCNRNDEPRRDPENVLRAFVKQLSVRSDASEIQDCLLQLYNNKKKSGFSSNKMTIEDCELLIPQLIKAYSSSTLVLDALDECDPQSRGELMHVLNRLVENADRLRIFISSRPDYDLKLQLKKNANVGIESTDNHDDIKKFVTEAIAFDAKNRPKPIKEPLRQKIIQTLLEKSNGMFQWASLQISQLLSLRRESDINNRLGKLPKDLKTAYDEIFSRITDQEGSEPEIANRAFQWVIASCRPLSITELVVAVCQDPESDTPEEVDIDIDFVLGACHNLLVIDKSERVVFAHLSVQEYFEEHHWNPYQANTLISKVSLIFLNHSWPQDIQIPVEFDEENQPAEAEDDLIRLLSYVNEYWAKHVQIHDRPDPDSQVCHLLQKFLGSMRASSLAYRRWLKFGSPVLTLRAAESGIPWSRFFDGEIASVLEPSSLAALAIFQFGFYYPLHEWWQRDMTLLNIERTNVNGDTLLALSAQVGQLHSVKMLVLAGVDCNKAGTVLGSPLYSASCAGHYTVVEYLLNSEAEVNGSGRCGTALAVASYFGHQSIVDRLLAVGADVNRAGGTCHTPLQAASLKGYENVVERLLAAGADINLAGGQHHTPLQAAIYVGHENIVERLLAAGADINLAGGMYHTVIQAASLFGGENLVERLLAAGADVNSAGGGFHTPLQAASYRGDKRIVEMLLAAGAHVNLAGGRYHTPLQAASYCGYYNIAVRLLAAGADVGIAGGRYGTAMLAALQEPEFHADSWSKKCRIVGLLFDAGAELPPGFDWKDGKVWDSGVEFKGFNETLWEIGVEDIT